MAVHYASVHDSNPSTWKSIGLETVTGSIIRVIDYEDITKGSLWIFQLKPTIFPGLNEELDLRG